MIQLIMWFIFDTLYTYKLSDLEQELLINTSLDSIYSTLIKRFKELASSIIKNIGKIRFSIANL